MRNANGIFVEIARFGSWSRNAKQRNWWDVCLLVQPCNKYAEFTKFYARIAFISLLPYFISRRAAKLAGGGTVPKWFSFRARPA